MDKYDFYTEFIKLNFAEKIKPTNFLIINFTIIG